MEISNEKLIAFAMRRFNSITSDETVGQSYEKIFGPCPDAEEQGRKMMKRAVVKRKMEEMMQQMQDWSVANVGQTAVLAANNIKKFIAEALMAAPNEADLDNPLCDVKVTRNGDKIPVFPDKLGLLSLAAKVEKLVGADTSVQVNIPSWNPTVTIEGERGWVEVPAANIT